MTGLDLCLENMDEEGMKTIVEYIMENSRVRKKFQDRIIKTFCLMSAMQCSIRMPHA